MLQFTLLSNNRASSQLKDLETIESQLAKQQKTAAAGNKAMWKDRQLPGKVIGITPSAISDNILLSTDLDVLDSSMLHCKGAEIASWLHENNMQEVPYVIIDDEYVILESQLPHFILTNPYDGLIEELAMRAIGILNRQ